MSSREVAAGAVAEVVYSRFKIKSPKEQDLHVYIYIYILDIGLGSMTSAAVPGSSP